ncbi:MAG: hypothetical protein R3C31_12425 [Hyphomonadaceae bacterium]
MATWVTLTCDTKNTPLHLNLDMAIQIEDRGDRTLIWFSGSAAGEKAVSVKEPVHNVLALAHVGLNA